MPDITNPIRNDRDMMWIAAVMLVPVAYHFFYEEISLTNQRLIILAFVAGYLWLCIGRLRHVVEEQAERIWQLERETGVSPAAFRVNDAGEPEITLAERVKGLERQITSLQQ